MKKKVLFIVISFFLLVGNSFGGDVGHNEIGNYTTDNWAGYSGFFLVQQPNENGTLKSFSVYGVSATGRTIYFCLYRKTPTEDLLVNDLTGIALPTSPGWVTLNVSAYSLTANTYYWIGFRVPAGAAAYIYEITSYGLNGYYKNGGSSFSDPLGSFDGSPGYQQSLYYTYETGNNSAQLRRRRMNHR